MSKLISNEECQSRTVTRSLVCNNSERSNTPESLSQNDFSNNLNNLESEKSLQVKELRPLQHDLHSVELLQTKENEIIKLTELNNDLKQDLLNSSKLIEKYKKELTQLDANHQRAQTKIGKLTMEVININLKIKKKNISN